MTDSFTQMFIHKIGLNSFYFRFNSQHIESNAILQTLLQLKITSLSLIVWICNFWKFRICIQNAHLRCFMSFFPFNLQVYKHIYEWFYTNSNEKTSRLLPLWQHFSIYSSLNVRVLNNKKNTSVIWQHFSIYSLHFRVLNH